MELTATDVVGISRVVVKYICVGKVSPGNLAGNIHDGTHGGAEGAVGLLDVAEPVQEGGEVDVFNPAPLLTGQPR